MKAFQQWCDAVTDQVRFRPDRAGIARELTAHYEDHVKDLERIGYDRELAESRALGIMGDPEEIGRAMDRVHRPALGWLWMASRAVLIGWLILLAWYAVAGEGWQWIRRDLWLPPESGDYEADGYHSNPDSSEYTRVAVTGGTSVELGGYRISVPYAAIWKWSRGEDYSYWLSAVILAEDDRFWDDGPDGALRELWATDDRGNLYPPYEIFYADDLGLSAPERDDKWAGYISVGRGEGNPFCQSYWVRSRHMAEIPAWMELTSPNVDGLTLRMEWEAAE